MARKAQWGLTAIAPPNFPPGRPEQPPQPLTNKQEQSFRDVFRSLFGQLDSFRETSPQDQGFDLVRRGFDRVHNVFPAVYDLDTGPPRHYDPNTDGPLGRGDLIVYCNMDHLDFRKNGDVYDPVEKKTFADPQDAKECRAKVSSLQALTSPSITGPQQIYFCQQALLLYTGTVGKFKNWKRENPNKWAAKTLTKAGDVVMRRPRIDAFALLDQVALHELTHLYPISTADAPKDKCYGWEHCVDQGSGTAGVNNAAVEMTSYRQPFVGERLFCAIREKVGSWTFFGLKQPKTRRRRERTTFHEPEPLPEERPRALTPPISPPYAEGQPQFPDSSSSQTPTYAPPAAAASSSSSSSHRHLNKSQRTQQQPRTYSQIQSSLLTRLPAELRLQIWRHVLGDDLIHLVRCRHRIGYRRCLGADGTLRSRGGWSEHDYCWGECATTVHDGQPKVRKEAPVETARPLLPLVKTCRKVYTEAIPLLYTTNHFSLNHIETLISLHLTLLPHRLSQIRSLTLSWRLTLAPYKVQRSSDSNAASLVIGPNVSPPPHDLGTWESACAALAAMTGLRDLHVIIEPRPGNFPLGSAPLKPESWKPFLDPLQKVMGWKQGAGGGGGSGAVESQGGGGRGRVRREAKFIVEIPTPREWLGTLAACYDAFELRMSYGEEETEGGDDGLEGRRMPAWMGVGMICA
ncbi:MAG: hypothetical protein M1831_002954 [Alyxoria varia]|nr:MAG: hypothetical protein M1831_002954 [Alyxoria varia]